MSNAEQPPNAIQARVAACIAGTEPALIAQLPAGFVVLFDHQPDPIRGWCMLLPHFAAPHADPAINEHRDPAAGQLNDLTPAARALFLADLARVGDALLVADLLGQRAEHVNYLMLCNQAPALHAHIVPRVASEDAQKRLADPFVAYPVPSPTAPDASEPMPMDRAALTASIRAQLA